ncbi:MAG: glycosyltransferase [Thermodesulfobacteriota bacterium]
MIKLRPIRPDEKIAVAIPTKNRPGYLAILLTSLLNQTYTNFTIVINDQSDSPVERDDAVSSLLAVAKDAGHEIVTIHTEGGWKRHQQAMEAVPEPIEFIIRIDDDMLPDKSFVESMLKSFRFFAERNLAAVGGCFPSPGSRMANLDVKLTEKSYASTLDDLVWKLQGYCYYNDPEVIEVESLAGGAICYRRGAVEDAGGWAVEGYSDIAYREESDLCARLVRKNYALMVTTEAVAWHLFALGGGARKYVKTPYGSIMVEGKSDMESDGMLFEERMKEMQDNSRAAACEPKRYKVSDLEKNVFKGSPLRTLRGRTLKAIESNFLRNLRGLYWYFRK